MSEIDRYKERVRELHEGIVVLLGGLIEEEVNRQGGYRARRNKLDAELGNQTVITDRGKGELEQIERWIDEHKHKKIAYILALQVVEKEIERYKNEEKSRGNDSNQI